MRVRGWRSPGGGIGSFAFMKPSLTRRLIITLLTGQLVALIAGCERKDKPPAPGGGGLVTQGDSKEAASTYADPNLAELTRELRRWIVKTKQRPASFEDFAAKAQIQVPPPPAGKKYALSKEMRVILADR